MVHRHIGVLVHCNIVHGLHYRHSSSTTSAIFLAVSIIVKQNMPGLPSKCLFEAFSHLGRATAAKFTTLVENYLLLLCDAVCVPVCLNNTFLYFWSCRTIFNLHEWYPICHQKCSYHPWWRICKSSPFKPCWLVLNVVLQYLNPIKFN